MFNDDKTVWIFAHLNCPTSLSERLG